MSAYARSGRFGFGLNPAIVARAGGGTLAKRETASRAARERDTLRSLIHWRQSHTPLPELTGRLNRPLRGWANYFGLGYPRKAFRGLNHFVRYRLGKHLHRRSQRGWRAREGVSLYAHLERLGLRAL
ncbi:MAG TPA: group II intron maturase-specific domain-containing protein [Verrucomicrobiota bacterium]|nr:group II intron maturase-specific domain-containing protein [Verrucomicrobiota bacterium]